MSGFILAVAAVVMLCLLLNKLSGKVGVPTLALFILLGMLFGSDGLLKIPFDNFVVAERVCSIALIFIIFYGGFGTSWRQARPVVVEAALLSSLGVALTAALVGVFCHYALGFSFWESMLVGAVISSTDAASVFSILRSKKLNLKYGTASLLEVESGSNDPFSYMLTFVVLAVMNGKFEGEGLLLMVTQQVALGVAVGGAAGFAASAALRRLRLAAEGADAIFVFGMALVAYAGADYMGGNGYLSAYIAGIVLGNQAITNKKSLVHFFDGLTGLMQITLFFLLGLLSFPSQFASICLPALGIALFLTFIARPLAVVAILAPFRCPVKQQVLVAWSGLRGAASIVFAIMATVNPAYMHNDVFHITFFIVIFSIVTQGSLIPAVARKLGMIDDSVNVMKTFTDYSEETALQFVRFAIIPEHPWANRQIKDIARIPDLLLVMILRNGEKVLPRGDVTLLEGDTVVLTTLSASAAHVGGTADEMDALLLTEMKVEPGNDWINQSLAELRLPKEMLVVAVRRGNAFFIPHGQSVIQEGDTLVLHRADAAAQSV